MNPLSLTTAMMRPSSNPIEPDDQLHRALDARLLAEPRVIDFRRSIRDELILSSAVAPPGSVTRKVWLIDRILTVVAIPADAERPPALRRRLRNHWQRSELLVVSERWLRRRPHFDGSELIAASARYPVPALSRLLIAEHLTESGGSSYLTYRLRARTRRRSNPGILPRAYYDAARRACGRAGLARPARRRRWRGGPERSARRNGFGGKYGGVSRAGPQPHISIVQ